jgi:3-mercaptopropionate dioxygenase
VTYTLRQFIEESEAIVRDQSNESQKLAQLKPRLEQLIQSYSIPAQAFTPRQDRFAMNLLHLPHDKAYSIIGGVWKPGQTTPIHDHLTWALVGVYSGQERETLYRRTDDKTDPRYAKLEKLSERVNTNGHVTVLNHNGIHKVDNVSPEPTQSIHVYGRDIGNTERHSYDPLTGEIGRFVSGYCNVLRDDEPY